MSRDTLQVIDHYEILEIVGQGGMSTVYKALDTQLQRPVALKLMHNHLANKPDFQSRFLAEGRAIATLDHPGIIRVYEVALRDNQLFLVMEYVEGGTLRTRLNTQLAEERFLDLREIVSVMRQIAEALHYAHQQGIIHRDVKPDNVLLKAGSEVSVSPLGYRTVLSDFGLAKRVDGGGPLTAPGELLGTLAYMAPEQFRGTIIDSRCDVYSLGVMLYELVSGRTPFQSDSAVELILMHTQGEPERIQDLRPDTPPALVSIMHRAMLKNPNDRYQTAGEIARELEALEKAIKPITQAKTWKVPRPTPITTTGSVTIYDVLPVLDRPAIPVDMFSEGGDDIIIVTPMSGASWRVPFEKASMTVGRDVTCDLQLDDPRVSRQHVRIDRLPDGQIVIADLGSLNGLFIGDEKVDKNSMSEWSSSQSIKVGPFWLTLRLARSPGGIGRRLTLNPPRTIETKIGSQDAVLRMTPAEAVVEPGSVAIARVEIVNNSHEAQRFALSIQGLPPDWFTIAPFPLFIPHGVRAERSITFHPPRLPASAATAYDFVLAAAPQLSPPSQPTQPGTHSAVLDRQSNAASGVINGLLHVVPYFDFDSTIQPGPHGFQIVITNKGNSVRYYVVEVRDRQNVLLLIPARVRVQIMPGQSLPVEIKVQSKHRPLIGLQRAQPIEVSIRTDGIRPHTQTFEYAPRPLIPWEMFVLLLLVVGLVLLLVSHH